MSVLSRALETTAREFDTTVDAIRGPGRTRHLSAARFALWSVLVRDLGMSYQDAAAAAGRSDHTTICYALDRASELETDPRHAARVAAIRRAALGQQTTPADCLAWLDQWRRIRAAVRWYGDAAGIETDDAIEDVTAALAQLAPAVRQLSEE